MLPHNRLGRQLNTHLKVAADLFKSHELDVLGFWTDEFGASLGSGSEPYFAISANSGDDDRNVLTALLCGGVLHPADAPDLHALVDMGAMAGVFGHFRKARKAFRQPIYEIVMPAEGSMLTGPPRLHVVDDGLAADVFDGPRPGVGEIDEVRVVGPLSAATTDFEALGDNGDVGFTVHARPDVALIAGIAVASVAVLFWKFGVEDGRCPIDRVRDVLIDVGEQLSDVGRRDINSLLHHVDCLCGFPRHSLGEHLETGHRVGKNIDPVVGFLSQKLCIL